MSEMAMRLRRTLASGAALAVSTVGLAAMSSSSAEAARLPRCHSYKTYSQPSPPSSGTKRYVSLPITNGPTVNCSLMKGDSGAGVETLQKSLNFCYKTRLTVDGDFGTKTRTALAKVQIAAGGLTDDGVYGPKTRKRILWKVDWHNGTASGSECKRVPASNP